jgi:hypothetical protein
MSLGRILPATHLAVCINQIKTILLSQYLRLLKQRKEKCSCDEPGTNTRLGSSENQGA